MDASHPDHSPVLCPACDLLLRSVRITGRQACHCPRCGRRLHRGETDSIEKTLALALTGLLLFPAATMMPLLGFDVLGLKSSASLVTSITRLLELKQYGMGIVVLLVGFAFPLLVLTLLFVVSIGLRMGRSSPWMARCFRLYHHLAEWAMTDVYLIGILVTIIKMSHMAAIEYGIGFFCFTGLVLTTIAAQSTVDHHLFWSRLDPDPEPAPALPSGAATGREAGLCLCSGCEKVLPMSALQLPCPRCGERVELRRPASVSRTWALVVTAIILTLPANLLPIMEVEYFGLPDRSTIMDGIVYFFQEGSYGIGAIILTASILVPLFKIFGLIMILLSIHFRWRNWLRHKTLMFRFIEFIGRWSMLDIFVIALLTALVRFGLLSTINPAPAALYFTGVVLSTMFAAIVFDPRLLWDAASDSTENAHATA